MGIFSEIAEEMEEKAYRRGFFHGMIWPLMLPVFGYEKLYWLYLSWKWKRQDKKWVQEQVKQACAIAPQAPHLISYNKLKQSEGYKIPTFSPAAEAEIKEEQKSHFEDISISPLSINDWDFD